MANLYVKSSGSNTAPYDTWAKAATSLATAVTAAATGDSIWVDSAFTESIGATTSYDPALDVKIISTSSTAEPPTTMNAGAAITITGAGNDLNISSGYWYGFVLTAVDYITLNNHITSGKDTVVEKCTMNAGRFSVGATSSRRRALTTRNCTFAFSGVSSSQIGCTDNWWSTNDVFSYTTGSQPSQILNPGSFTSLITFCGADFSSISSALYSTAGASNSVVRLAKCKLHSSFAIGTMNSGSIVEVHSCASGDSVIDYKYADYYGEIGTSISIYLTSGGSQMKEASGTLTSYSLEMNPSTVASKVFPLYSPWVSKFIGSTGSKTFSLKVAYDSATALTDSECWLEVEYYKSAGDPLSSVEVSAPIAESISRDILTAGTNLTDTSAAWTGTGGWTNKKTATLSKTVTVNQQGYVRCRVAVAKDVTVYADQVIGVA